MENEASHPKLYIKDMVCQRCIITVDYILKNLNIPYHKIELGEVETAGNLSYTQLAMLQEELQKVGFDLVESRVKKVVEEVKRKIREYLNQNNDHQKLNLSAFIIEKIPYEYSYLSDLFSSVEGVTIEKFFIQQRIEKVKELIIFDQLSLTEIAYKTGFSSVHHLSAQFKKITGLSPSQFRKQGNVQRKFVDRVNPKII